jgi:hypothetical protein
MVLAVFLSPVAAKVIYVDANAPGPTHNGSSWTNAYKHLQDALADADSAAKPVEIQVAQGIYTPDSNSAYTNGSGDRRAAFSLINGVTIQGGYAGYGQPDPNTRDIKLYESILSGDLDGNDVEVNDPADLLDEPTRAENSYHIVFSSSIDASAVLDGFTITGGNAYRQDIPIPVDSGGGIYSDEYTPGSPTVTNCSFIENSAYAEGGAMANSGYFDECSPILTNCKFSRNWAAMGGAMFNSGFFGSCKPKLINCLFTGNVANVGGGIANTGNLCDVTLTNCTFTNNSAGGGGGILNWGETLTLTNCILWGDEPEEIYGDAIVDYSCIEDGWPGQGNIDVDPCFVRKGYWEPVINPLPGQASVPNPSDGATSVNTIADLSWTAGSGATSHDVYFGTTSVPPFIGNQTSTTFHPGTMAYVTQYFWRIDELNIGGKTTGQLWSFTTQDESPPPPPPPLISATSYISENQHQYIWINGDYHLRPDSPCINAGDPNYVAAPNEVDLDGKERLFRGRIDMGAYEYQVTTIYVDANAPGPTHDGSSWANAYKFLQDALADAGSAAKPVEIIIAQAIYKPDQTSANPNGSGSRTATFRLINGVTLKGGYAGFGEPDPYARDIEFYETILSGDLNSDDLPSYPYNLDDNCFNVVTGSSTEPNAVLDGLTISRGLGNGMYNYHGSPTVANCTFSNNYSISGMFNTHFSEPVVTNCKFSLNMALENGGAMCNEDSNAVVTGCTFVENSAERFGGAVYNEQCSPTFDYCTFSENLAEHGGGGMYNNNSSPTLTNCTFERNWSGLFGGGLDTVLASSNPIVIGCTFIGNSADFRGGGTSNGTSSMTLINCIFINNSAMDKGGAMNSCNGMNINVRNCTFYGNQAPNGNLLVCSCSPFNVQFTNCIMWDGGNEIWNPPGSIITLTYSNVYGGRMSVYDPCESMIWGTGNIDTDPCFADANNGDYHLKSQAGRWDPNSQSWVRDDVTSPCIDAGNPGCPLGDEPNGLNNVRINMGAYGGTAEASKSPPYWRSIADTTNDWVVNSNDLKVLVGYWLQMGECLPGDFDRSRFVDFNDFAIFGGQWCQKGPGPGITYEVEECIPTEFALSAAGESEPTRFTVTVEGSNIHFEDLITANCCADEIELLMTVEDDLITIYEIEHTPMPPCPCICDYPITATLGPFQPGSYTLDVYDDGTFIGTTTVTIAPDS